MKCPVCSETDYVQYVFVQYVKPAFGRNIVSDKNPGDDHFIFMCPNKHVYDENGELI